MSLTYKMEEQVKLGYSKAATLLAVVSIILFFIDDWEDTIELTLPAGVEVDQLTFLSVWCRKLGINFGIVEFPLKKELYD